MTSLALLPLLVATSPAADFPSIPTGAGVDDETSPADPDLADGPETPDLEPGTRAIINGSPAGAGDYPMTGTMILDGDFRGYGQMRMYVCSATLIAPDVVLLAAHCVSEQTYEMYGLQRINEIRFTRDEDVSAYDGQRLVDWPAGSIPAAEWVWHDRFNINTMGMGLAQNYDIALLFLATPITDVPYAYVVTAEEASQVVEGASVEIVGWGYEEGDYNASTEYGHKNMGTTVIGPLNEWEMQIGPAQTDVRKCHGDSGGPTFMTVTTDSPETTRQIGVTSHAYDRSDCRRTGGVDTRVDAYLDWIDEQMRAACADGTRSWCEVDGIILPPDPPPPPDTEDTSADPDGPGGNRGGVGGACGCATPAGRTGLPALVLALLGLVVGTRRRRS